MTDNDRLLELAYAGTPQGCRHEWQEDIWADHCGKCQRGWAGTWHREDRPAVGDGHQMTLGEMARLAYRLFPGCEVILNDAFAIVYWRGCDNSEDVNGPDDFERALGVAILIAAEAAGLLAAVDATTSDGERK